MAAAGHTVVSHMMEYLHDFEYIDPASGAYTMVKGLLNFDMELTKILNVDNVVGSGVVSVVDVRMMQGTDVEDTPPKTTVLVEMVVKMEQLDDVLLKPFRAHCSPGVFWSIGPAIWRQIASSSRSSSANTAAGAAARPAQPPEAAQQLLSFFGVVQAVSWVKATVAVVRLRESNVFSLFPDSHLKFFSNDSRILASDAPLPFSTVSDLLAPGAVAHAEKAFRRVRPLSKMSNSMSYSLLNYNYNSQTGGALEPSISLLNGSGVEASCVDCYVGSSVGFGYEVYTTCYSYVLGCVNVPYYFYAYVRGSLNAAVNPVLNYSVPPPSPFASAATSFAYTRYLNPAAGASCVVDCPFANPPADHASSPDAIPSTVSTDLWAVNVLVAQISVRAALPVFLRFSVQPQTADASVFMSAGAYSNLAVLSGASVLLGSFSCTDGVSSPQEAQGCLNQFGSGSTAQSRSALIATQAQLDAGYSTPIVQLKGRFGVNISLAFVLQLAFGPTNTDWLYADLWAEPGLVGTVDGSSPDCAANEVRTRVVSALEVYAFGGMDLSFSVDIAGETIPLSPTYSFRAPALHLYSQDWAKSPLLDRCLDPSLPLSSQLFTLTVSKVYDATFGLNLTSPVGAATSQMFSVYIPPNALPSGQSSLLNVTASVGPFATFTSATGTAAGISASTVASLILTLLPHGTNFSQDVVLFLPFDPPSLDALLPVGVRSSNVSALLSAIELVKDPTGFGQFAPLNMSAALISATASGLTIRTRSFSSYAILVPSQSSSSDSGSSSSSAVLVIIVVIVVVLVLVFVASGVITACLLRARRRRRRQGSGSSTKTAGPVTGVSSVSDRVLDPSRGALALSPLSLPVPVLSTPAPSSLAAGTYATAGASTGRPPVPILGIRGQPAVSAESMSLNPIYRTTTAGPRPSPSPVPRI